MEEGKQTRICSVANAIDILGDRWIFLILREAFFGIRSYDRFQKNLKIATNILSNRLKILVENDIMSRHKDADDARRFTYRLTKKGLDIYPIVLAFMNWGDKWLADDDGPPLVLHHEACNHHLQPVMSCRHCGEEVSPRDVSYTERYKEQTGRNDS